MQRRSNAYGFLLIVISAVSYGALAVMARYAYRSGANVTGILLPRFAIASLFLVVVMRFARAPWPSAREAWVAVGMGAIGYVGQSACYFSALQYASAGLVGLLLYVYPAIVTLLAALFLREPLTSGRLVALVASSTGLWLTIEGGSGQPLGIFLALTSALLYSVYITVGGRFLRSADPIATSTLVCGSAFVVYAVAAVVVQPARFPSDGTGWMALAGIALISTVLAIFCFFAGLRVIGASRAAILSTLEPIVTVLLAAALLDDPLTLTQIGGGTLILAATVLLAVQR